jgi:hypothetical protein
MRDKLTVLTTTNFVPSCPSTALIESVIRSLNRKFGIEEYDHYIFYDRPRQPSADDDRYLDALRALDAKFPSTITVFDQRFVGLRGGWLRMLSETRTPYFLFLEHDWHFNEEPVPPLDELIDVLERYEFVNYMRFNKMNATMWQWEHWDKKHEPESRVRGIDLTRVWSWSNNPHFGRTEMVVGQCVPIVESKPFLGSLDPTWQGWPCGVEGPIWDTIDGDVRELGFDSAHRKWGTYFIGTMGSRNTIEHVCGRTWRG